MTRIAILDDWQGIAETAADWSAVRAHAELVFFRDHLGTPDQVAATLAGFDAIVAMRERTRLHADVITRLPNLKLLSFTGARNAAVDIPACTAQGVVVCNTTTTRSSHGTAELALGLMLAALRHIPTGDAEMRAGRFQANVPPGGEVAGRTLGLLGLGNIGSRVARYAQAMDMKTIAWSQNLTAERAAAIGVTRVDKAELFARADVVSIHLVLSDRTRHIVAAAEIAAMKPGALLVNTSRGPHVDPDALLPALEQGRIRAAIDVYDTEPLPAAHPLRRAPGTVLTPHLGYVTAENMPELYRSTAENLAAWLAGTPIRVLNPEAVKQG
ncbi:MAG: D-2-hydroxyacid dehydrogenase family protein [Acetobacteraceae bacterium]|nr:D-2-hydroxyacid dehydrogenase family protein [Acetobacteraceae bacterium]